MGNSLRTCRRRRGRPHGFAYILLLIAIAVLGITSAAAVSLGSQISRRDAETQLLAIGAEFERALRSYRSVRGNVASMGPRSLEDLLKDPSRPALTRHLRQIYADPMTGKAEWGIKRAPDGTISGIYSLAAGEPIKRSGFDERHAGFSDARAYADWTFTDAQAPADQRPSHPATRSQNSVQP
ncbi:MAG TPA: type II secretion system protein [Burkholderiaceae bacterium]